MVLHWATIVNLLLTFLLVFSFKILLFCLLQPEDYFRLNRNSEESQDELRNLRIIMAPLRGFKNYLKRNESVLPPSGENG